MVVTSAGGQSSELRLVAGILAGLGTVRANPADLTDSWAAAADLAAIKVLDCGGGTGRMAVPVAQLGAQVTVVDISADALATLSRRATEAGVADRVRGVSGDVEALSDCLGGEVFDLALVHGVLDAVDARLTMAGVYAALRPGAVASVLLTNPAAGVLAKVLAGDLEAALDDLHSSVAWGADPITALCGEVGLTIERVRGVGVFSELGPDGPDGTTATGRSVALLWDELESVSSGLSPFREIAARLHVLARRPVESV